MESLSLYHLDEGNTHLINQQYKASIECYTHCIDSASLPPSADTSSSSSGSEKSQVEFIAFRAYSHRAEAYLRLNDYQNAKEDILKSHSIILPSSSSSSSQQYE